MIQKYLRKCPSEVISTDLILWYQGILDEIVVPLLQDVIVLRQISIVICSLLSRC